MDCVLVSPRWVLVSNGAIVLSVCHWLYVRDLPEMGIIYDGGSITTGASFWWRGRCSRDEIECAMHK
ncbi:hypothetical protein Tco_0371275 [Tanacetum coccineum]